MDNAWIADRLEAFASLLDLADANPELAVRTARRGWATTADVVNTGPLSSILRT